MLGKAHSKCRALFMASVLPLCVMLSACGGGAATAVASIPAPPATPVPTPTPTPAPPTTYDTPLTRVGTYDLIGSLTGNPGNGTVAAGKYSLAVISPGIAYRLTGPAGFLPGGLTSAEFEGPPSASTNSLRFGDNTTLPFNADKSLRIGLGYDLGYSYVSMGEWNWYFVHPDGGTADGGYGELVFATGDRTLGSQLPVSGTATYDAHSFALKSSSDLTAGIPFFLTADFGQRTISTRIDQDYRYEPNGDLLDYPAPGIHVAGSAPFTNGGAFDIPLTGTVNWNGSYALNTQQAPSAQPVTGNMSGAFFGPHAEQVGGVFSLTGTGGVQVLQDAFIGQQRKP